MDIKHLITIVITVGVVYLSIKVIAELFKKKKANRDKKNEINFKIQNAFEAHENNIEEMQKKYDKLYSEFIAYKRETEKSLSQMEEYTDRIIKISNEIITFDEAFEEKLSLWCDLLNNSENSETVKKQIREHLDIDIKFRDDIKLEQEQQRIQRYQNIRHSFGLDR